MPSLTVAEYLKFANLQMAAEALYNFDANKNSNLIPGQDATGLLTADNLTTGNRHASAFAPTQVTFSQLTDDWAVVEHKSNTTTGFSGTLFKRNGANEFVLSLRSTEFADDAARDNEATNLQEIKAKGWAFGQIADMEDWYAGLKSRITGSLSVTGYSLGGHLATAFNLLHPDAAQQVVTFNGAGIGAIAGANDLSSLSTQLTEMIAHFRSLRQQAASANGLIDAFHSEGGRQAYQALRAALAGKDGVPAAGMKALVDKYAPTKADEDILWQADRDLLIRQTLTGDGNGALIRALAVLDYAHYAPEQKSGSSDPTAPARAARVPDTYLDPVTKQQQLAIAGAGLDYQLAVLLTAEKYRTSALSLAGSIAAIAGTGTRGVATLPNQIDVAATEMDTNTPTFMVAHSQYRYGTEQRIFIENQPLTRGDVVSESIQASFKHFAIRALVDKYTINDFGDTHSLVLLIDTLNVQNTLANLLPPGQSTKTTLETLDAIFKTASYLKAESASGTQGKAEGDVIESVVNAMAAMFLPPDDATKVRLHGNPKGGTWADIKNGDKYTGRDALYASLTAIVGSAAYKALADAAKNGLVSLVPPTTEGSKARTDYAQFLALYHLAPFALQTDNEGALAALKAADKDLSEQWQKDIDLGSDQGESGKAHFSDTWLTDRAEFLKRKQWFGENNQEPEVIKRVLAGKNPPPLHAYQTEATYYEDLASGYRIAQEFDPDDEESAKRKTVKHYRFGGTGDDAITGGDVDDHLYGGDGHDTLTGRGGADRLEGGTGNDIFDGGKGDDRLYGGKGWDTYLLRGGDGNDTLVDINGETGDKIKEGRLLVGSTDPSKAMRGLGVLLEKDDTTWVSPDGTTTLRKEQGEEGDRWTLSLPEGGSVDLGAEFKEGDFGLRRLKLAEGNPDKLLEGDLLPKDFDTRTPDVLDVVHDPDGNVVISDAKTKAPNREDHLIGTLGVDSIQGKGGDDVLEGDRAAERDGGDDSTAQNDGGDDRLEGGVGSDIVAGQGGNDLLWGESAPADATTTNDSITAALESGDTAESKATRGDWIDGGKGDDILIGDVAKDLLTGGLGSDLLIGGAGDDLLHGDRTIKVGSSREWEVTVDPKVPFDPKSPDQVKTEYTWTIKNGDTVGNDTEGGDDSLYGGKGDDWLLGGAGNDLLEGGDDDDVLFGEAGHDTLLGGAGSDVLHGDSPDITEDKFGNWLDGGSEDDEIFGGKGADVLIGGTGDDFLRGGEGRDTYIYNKGDGKDRVYDKDADKDSSVFVFGEGISAKDIILRKGSLLLDFGDGDELHIEEFNADDPLTNPSVASFEFADGGSFTWEELLARGFDLDGIEGDDLLTGTALQDRVDGKAGNDALQSGAGNDRLTGGAGTDALDGGLGDDTYVFHAGDGASRSIQINGETALQVETVVDEGGVDTLVFDASVDTRTLQLIDNDEGNLLIRYGSQAQAEQGQEGSDLLLVGQGLAGNIEHVQVGAGGTATQLSMTRFIGQYGEGVYRGTDATGHTHLTGGRSADFIVGSNGEEVSGGRGNAAGEFATHASRPAAASGCAKPLAVTRCRLLGSAVWKNEGSTKPTSPYPLRAISSRQCRTCPAVRGDGQRCAASTATSSASRRWRDGECAQNTGLWEGVA